VYVSQVVYVYNTLRGVWAKVNLGAVGKMRGGRRKSPRPGAPRNFAGQNYSLQIFGTAVDTHFSCIIFIRSPAADPQFIYIG